MIRALLFLLALLLSGPAAAHSLRLFAKVEGREVSGYGFFVGGGRPHGADWSARMAGLPLARGETDAEGGFRFEVPEAVTGDVVIALDTGEGHMARVTLPPERFGGAPVPSGAIPLKAGGPALPVAEERPSAPAPTEDAPSPRCCGPSSRRRSRPRSPRFSSGSSRWTRGCGSRTSSRACS